MEQTEPATSKLCVTVFNLTFKLKNGDQWFRVFGGTTMKKAMPMHGEPASIDVIEPPSERRGRERQSKGCVLSRASRQRCIIASICIMTPRMRVIPASKRAPMCVVMYVWRYGWEAACDLAVAGHDLTSPI